MKFNSNSSDTVSKLLFICIAITFQTIVSCSYFLFLQLLVTHRVVILQTIELVVGSRIEIISYPRIRSVITLASDEMTRSKVDWNANGSKILVSCYSLTTATVFLQHFQEVIPDWQQAASNILVAVGNKHINDIMEEILSKFQPGLLPHFFVVQTLANLSDSNGTKMLKALTNICLINV